MGDIESARERTANIRRRGSATTRTNEPDSRGSAAWSTRKRRVHLKEALFEMLRDFTSADDRSNDVVAVVVVGTPFLVLMFGLAVSYIAISLKEIGNRTALSIANFTFSILGLSLYLLLALGMLKEEPLGAAIIVAVFLPMAVVLIVRFVRFKLSILDPPNDGIAIALALPAVFVGSALISAFAMIPITFVSLPTLKILARCSIIEIDDEPSGYNSRRARIRGRKSRRELEDILASSALGMSILNILKHFKNHDQWGELFTLICCASEDNADEERNDINAAMAIFRDLIATSQSDEKKEDASRSRGEGDASHSAASLEEQASESPSEQGSTITPSAREITASIAKGVLSTKIESPKFTHQAKLEQLQDTNGDVEKGNVSSKKPIEIEGKLSPALCVVAKETNQSSLDRSLMIAQILEGQGDERIDGNISEDGIQFAIAKRMLLQEELDRLRETLQRSMLFHRGKTYAISPKRALLTRSYLGLIFVGAVAALLVLIGKRRLSYSAFKEIIFWVTFSLVTVFGVLTIMTNESNYLYNLMQGVKEIRDEEEMFRKGPLSKIQMQAVMYDCIGTIPWMKASNSSYSSVRTRGGVAIDLETRSFLLKAIGMMQIGNKVCRPGERHSYKIKVKQNMLGGNVWIFEAHDGRDETMCRVLGKVG